MVYVYKEKNNTGIGNCCLNNTTRAFCQSDLAAELAQDGTIIYRGAPLKLRKNGSLAITGGQFDSYNLFPPLRNEGGYDNANELGLYDNVNKSVGQRVPCNLKLEISGATNLNWCTDCEDLNGTYDSIPIFSSLASSDWFHQGTMWFWPLCNPAKIGNTCGASHAFAYLAFDVNDGFDPTYVGDGFDGNVDTVRDVFLNIGIVTLPIDYNPVTSDAVLPFDFGFERIYSSVDQSLIKKRVKVGEIKYKKYTVNDGVYGYYDSNVNATSWTDLEITDTVYTRDYCGATFKVTSMNSDDLVGLKRSVGYQVNTSASVGNGYGSYGKHGLSYAKCEDGLNVKAPSHATYGDFTTPPNLEIDTDAEWNITRVWEKHPHFWKVTIAGATGKAEPINGEHYLFVYSNNNDVYTPQVIEKVLYPFDSKIKPEGSYGDSEKVACAPCGQSGPEDVCLYDMTLTLGSSDSTMTFDFYLSGRDYLTWRYTGTASHSSNKGWIASPASLTYVPTGGYYEGTAVCNLRGLTITVENGNEWTDVNQLSCYPVPRASHCEGGKEPDAFLVEIDGSWDAGYLGVRRPVYFSTSLGVSYGRPYATCFGCNVDGVCMPSYEPFPEQYPSPVLKVIDDCWMCGNGDNNFWNYNPGGTGLGCFTNCDNQTWEGPVGSFVLTKVKSGNAVTDGSTNCFNDDLCNNGYDMATYSYKNGTSDTVCNWTGLTMRFGLNTCYVGPPSSIGIGMGVAWGRYNTAGNPDLTYCAEQAFHPDTCQVDDYYGSPGACNLLCGTYQRVDFNGCLFSSQLTCGGTNPCGGGAVIQDPSRPDRSPSIQFSAIIPHQVHENHSFIDCNDQTGFDLDVTNPEPTDDYAGFTFCRDEILPLPYPANLPVHASFTGTARATPIYY